MVAPNEEQIIKVAISRFNILYFFYISIRKIQQKYQKTKKNRIITRSSSYNTKKFTDKKIPVSKDQRGYDKK